MIEVLPNVRFKKIPVEMFAMFYAISRAAEEQGTYATITGAAYENYPKGKVHDRGYAIDVRVSGIPYPWQYASSIRSFLRAVSPYYVVLFGDPKHRNHIHIGFSWWFSLEEQRRRENGKRAKLVLGDQHLTDHPEALTGSGYTVDQGSVRVKPYEAA